MFLLLLPTLAAYQEDCEDVAVHLRERLSRLGLPIP